MGLSGTQKLALSQRLADALDEVLQATQDRVQVYPSQWGPGQQEFFIAFTRLVLMYGVLAHDEARNCGASDKSLPYAMLLFGLRPALESAGDAWSDVGGKTTEESPMGELAALAGPLQMIIGDRLDDDEVFIRAQKRIYPQLGGP